VCSINVEIIKTLSGYARNLLERGCAGDPTQARFCGHRLLILSAAHNLARRFVLTVAGREGKLAQGETRGLSPTRAFAAC
jgi:hypothetical protein